MTSITWQTVCLQVQEQAVKPKHYYFPKMCGSATQKLYSTWSIPSNTPWSITPTKYFLASRGRVEHAPIHHILIHQVLVSKTIPDIQPICMVFR